ncbi:hypothetical protein MP638_003686 [Amoeboaphelidium occidentale]|nr:hypothetical protein MP638_003686 [Amoeboaphelidium occidentale]
MILKITALSKETREILEREAEFVKPLMLKRKWVVEELQEFIPTSESKRLLLGLNVNRGKIVKIRMRQFPPLHNVLFELVDIIGTLLHELVHCSISDHNDAFFKLLDELWEEYYEEKERKLRLAGLLVGGGDIEVFAGRGYRLGDSTKLKVFAGRGYRLGDYDNGGSCLQISARDNAVNAALKRQQQQQDLKSNTLTDKEDIVVLWVCKNCTLNNEWELLSCEICNTLRDI